MYHFLRHLIGPVSLTLFRRHLFIRDDANDDNDKCLSVECLADMSIPDDPIKDLLQSVTCTAGVAPSPSDALFSFIVRLRSSVGVSLSPSPHRACLSYSSFSPHLMIRHNANDDNDKCLNVECLADMSIPDVPIKDLLQLVTCTAGVAPSPSDALFSFIVFLRSPVCVSLSPSPHRACLCNSSCSPSSTHSTTTTTITTATTKDLPPAL